MNEPNDNDYAAEAANSAVNDLEATKDEENPFRVQAKAAIERGDQVCHTVCARAGSTFERAKAQGWLVDYVAAELETPTPVDVAAEIARAFAYASGADIEAIAPKAADDDADDTDEGYRKCVGCGGEFAEEDCPIDEVGARCSGCAGRAEQPPIASPGMAALTARLNRVTEEALGNVPMTMTLETPAGGVFDASDDHVRQLGEQARKIATLEEQIETLEGQVKALMLQLKTADNALEYKTQESDRRLRGSNEHLVRVNELHAENGKQAKRIKALEKLVAKQPAAKKAPAKKPAAKKAPAKKRR